MSFTSLNITNFTVFEDLSMFLSPGINVIIGENGTGKTHLMKILYSRNYDALQRTRTNQENDKSEPYEFYDYFKGNIFRDLSISQNVGLSVGCRTNNMVFLPAKEMLSHSQGLLQMSKKYSKAMPFDRSYLDVIDQAFYWQTDEIPELGKKILPKIEKLIGGKVEVIDDNFYIVRDDHTKVVFSMEAEGIKKIAILWQLIMNENIAPGTILFWDEPEANINPKIIPDIVEILLELAKNGVQIFLATHNYIFAKYFEVKRTSQDDVQFHALYQTEHGVKCESNQNFRDLQHNSIMEAFNKLLDEVYYDLKE